MDRDRNQHSDPSGAPVDPRGPMSTQNFTRNLFFIVLEGIGDAVSIVISSNEQEITIKVLKLFEMQSIFPWFEASSVFQKD